MRLHLLDDRRRLQQSDLPYQPPQQYFGDIHLVAGVRIRPGALPVEHLPGRERSLELTRHGASSPLRGRKAALGTQFSVDIESVTAYGLWYALFKYFQCSTMWTRQEEGMRSS